MHTLYLILVLFGFVILLWFAKKVQDLFEKNLDYDIEENDNYFAALNRSGYLIGVGIALLGAFLSHKNTAHYDWFIFEVIQIVVFLQVANKFTTNYLLAGIKIKAHNNLTNGLVIFGVNMSTGIIAYGAFSGLGGEWYNPVVFFIIGQVLLIIVARLHQKFIAKNWNLAKSLENHNIGAGLLLMASLLSIAIIIAGATSGDSQGFKIDIFNFSISMTTGLILVLVVLLHTIDWLFLPNTTIGKEIETDKQVAPIILVSLLKIFFSIIAAILL